jgi:MFS family permease
VVEPRKSHSARYVLVLLFLINALNFFDRAVPAAVLEPLRRKFLLNDADQSLTAVAFTLLRALVGIPLGRLADVVKRTRVIAAGVFAWSAFTALSGASWNFISFAVARAAVGIGEASCAPAANSMISDLVPPSRRASATGLFMRGYPIGTLTGFLSVGAIAAVAGWRVPFFLAALPGAVLAFLILRCMEPARGKFEGMRSNRVSGRIANVWEVLRIPRWRGFAYLVVLSRRAHTQ